VQSALVSQAIATKLINLIIEKAQEIDI